jgi:hypothetical protein
VSDAPDDLRELDRRLRGIRFEPPASFGAELAGRVARGERPRPTGPPGRRRALLVSAALAAGGAALALGLPAVGRPAPVTIDRCCYDLDGGGAEDDGVRIVARRDAEVHRLWVYEDLDRSGGFTRGDVVRLERGGTPSLTEAAGGGLVTIQRCCLDFDGGGPNDDGLLVVGVPPDRVVMAAIYERSDPAPEAGRPSHFKLR